MSRRTWAQAVAQAAARAADAGVRMAQPMIYTPSSRSIAAAVLPLADRLKKRFIVPADGSRSPQGGAGQPWDGAASQAERRTAAPVLYQLGRATSGGFWHRVRITDRSVMDEVSRTQELCIRAANPGQPTPVRPDRAPTTVEFPQGIV